MSAYRRQASASIVPPTRSVRLQIARELCYAHRHRRHGRRSQSDQIGRNARYSLDPTDANATLGHGILLEFFPPRQTLPPTPPYDRARDATSQLFGHCSMDRNTMDASARDAPRERRATFRRLSAPRVFAAIPSRSRPNPKKKLDKKRNRVKSMNPHHLEIGGTGKLYSVRIAEGNSMRGRKVTIRRRSVLPSNRISIGSTMRETVAPRGSSRTSKHRAPRRRLIPRDIIRLWIIRGTRRTRTFRSANHANRYVILTSRCFVCPLAIESRGRVFVVVVAVLVEGRQIDERSKVNGGGYLFARPSGDRSRRSRGIARYATQREGRGKISFFFFFTREKITPRFTTKFSK